MDYLGTNMANLPRSDADEIIALKTQVRLLTEAYKRLSQEVKQLRLLIQDPD